MEEVRCMNCGAHEWKPWTDAFGVPMWECVYCGTKYMRRNDGGMRVYSPQWATNIRTASTYVVHRTQAGDYGAFGGE